MSQIHSQITGLEIHEPYHFVQESDPGAVGTGLYWLKVSTGVVNRRNSSNTGWNQISPSTGISDPTTTKGDLIARSSSALGRLAVGSDAKVLTADSTATLGVSWQTASGGGGSVPAWVTNHPDTPPTSPSSFDDEFTSSATLPGGGSAIWTALNGSNVALSIVPNGLQMILSPSTSAISGIQQNVPSSGAWTAITKVSIAGPFAANILIGMLVGDGTKLLTWSMVQVPAFDLQSWNSSTSINATIFSGIAGIGFVNVIYFKVHNDLTNYVFSYSVDGISYTQLAIEGVTSFLTATKMGLQMYCSNSNTMVATYKFFRVTQP